MFFKLLAEVKALLLKKSLLLKPVRYLTGMAQFALQARRLSFSLKWIAQDRALYMSFSFSR